MQVDSLYHYPAVRGPWKWMLVGKVSSKWERFYPNMFVEFC